ncbi:probable LRR receptor-like serine/threonine-protein kinase At1g05700 [Trifolium pratense]|uniref:probable LRR receptor-like serine/threonine-protein kinase At1g05700 n=1 Tax=Trifolium pratense TaxID=57577 RepID=UPI001E695393|nr:probable LRR receptor-like serine/threonine-protein kinase At1g05700 [Trifolium pratense]
MKQRKVAMLLQFFSVWLGVLTILVLIQAQEPGFISLDCGLPENSDYSSLETKINYISDAKFIDTGESKRVNGNIPVKQQLQYVRSFPIGVKNCYRIDVTNGTKYLIRASFYYGNYDNLNDPPQFDLTFGANVWDTVKFTNLSGITTSEIIYTPLLDYIQPCLVNTGTGTPFISAIELRPLNKEAYVSYSAKSILSLFFRFDIGSITNLEYRYKDDVYDRVWLPFEWNGMKQLSTDEGLLTKSIYNAPAIVMRTAATPVNVSAPVQIFFDAENVNEQYYAYLHFNEVEKLAENETRIFNITVNGVSLYEFEVPVYRSPDTIFSQTPMTGASRYIFSLTKTENSTLPPILNAFEIYIVKDFSQSETQQVDIDTITNIKNAYGVARNWQGDPCGPVKYMWEGLNCSIDDGNNPPRITSLNLSSNGLTGEIASSISNLTMLQYLDLSNNSLEGPLPDFLTQLHSLKVLNLRKNNLTGVVSSELLKRSRAGSLSLSVEDNPGLCTTETCNKKKKKKKNLSAPLIASFSALIVILLISFGFWRFRRQIANSWRTIAMPTSSNSKKKGTMKSNHQAFNYTELLNITDNFKTIIGEGGFGKVYLGTLQDQTRVAVKMLSPSSVQGYKEFQSEAQLLTVVHHRNLVSLIGYCDEDETKALIYEYMANGNLQQLLLVENSNILKWNERINIAVDASHGLDYLHNGCKPPIMHRDLKPSNILLDENMHAKIADFGLSRTFNDNDTHISTRLAGTFGYIDPECQRTGSTNKTNDIYSFGIILFVLITGRQAIVRTAEQSIHILEWVTSLIRAGDIENLVDPKLKGEFNISSAWKIVEIAMLCTSRNVDERPDIRKILAELNECLSLEMVQRNNGREKATDESTFLNDLSQTVPFPR